ncbi:MAG: prepilin peptidase [bacterium]|nr:prepilin peptidase [bacterium]
MSLRPGVALGPYPERRDVRPPFFSRALQWVRGSVGAKASVSRHAVGGFADSVEQAARGLGELREAQLDERLAALRVRLRREGFKEELLPEAFALLREAAGRTLGTPYYDVQLYGGLVMARRGLAELETGEGKTLTATLPAATAALAGIPVHVITANDYLVARDAASMAPLYQRLGLTTGTVVEEQPERAVRRDAYACDVTYVTNKQVAFDYLQDRLLVADGRRLARRLAQPREETTDGAVLRGLCFAVVDEADSVLIDDARTPLVLSSGGALPDERLVRTALWLAGTLEVGSDFRLDTARGTIEITPAGHAQLDERGHALEGPLHGARRREEWVHRALCALHLNERDTHYLVRDDRVEIIDAPTGRRSPDRAFEGGMHALIEAKEGVSLSPQRETLARISYQRFFRRYLGLAGMTGTASEVAQELWNVYGLATVRVPTRLPSKRRSFGTSVLPTAEARWDTTLERVRALHGEGRPVLVGTASVAASEALSGRLAQAELPHQVLNARQDADEASVIAQAGEAGRITVATQMAGRGTDIRLTADVEKSGGLAVLATELGEAARIDRQLFGRCARQGTAGSYEHLVSMEDRLLEKHLPAWLRGVLARGTLPPRLVIGFTKLAQLAEERRGALARRRLLESERVLGELLAFSGHADT